jgi:Na+/H+-dicarboxylate symporter
MGANRSPWQRFRRAGLHWHILAGLVAGAVAGGIVNAAGSAAAVEFVTHWVKPVGTLFVRLITMVAAPLVLASLVAGAASITDPHKLGRIGGRTLALYLVTTAIAITIGLVLAGLLQPGAAVSADMRARLLEDYGGEIGERIAVAQEFSLADTLVALVPANPFAALAEGAMLQIVVFALILGVALSMVPAEKGEPVVRFFSGLTEVLIRVVELVMKVAPYGVFALIAAITAEMGFGILGALGWYALVAVAGFLLHLFGVYGALLAFFSRMPPARFFRNMAAVQLFAFSSSSSAATLPLNMETARERLGVSDRVTSFVLPLGATVNMDGTALYQGVAAMFIAQIYGIPLGLADQVTIVLTATLASIGTASVPGAGTVMLVIVMKSVGIPVEGLALIMGMDRLLDMCRTAVNITGDAAVAVVVASAEGELEPPGSGG